MADPHLTEDEQVEKLKSWWKDNGTSVVTGAAIGIAAVAGYNFWSNHKQAQAEQASAYYDQMLNQYAVQESDGAATLGAQLMEEYVSTPYATKAALMMAKISVEKEDHASAELQLRWAMENAPETATEHTARLRLAYLLLSTDKAADAESLLTVSDMGGFESQYQELRGDVFASENRIDDARAAYEKSLESLDGTSGHRQLLQLKLNNLSADAAK